MLAVWLGPALCLISSGCTYERVVKDSFPELRKLADPPPRERRRSEGPSIWETMIAERQADLWAVLLEEFQGRGAAGRARSTQRNLERRLGWLDLWTQEQGDSVRLYRGRFQDPTQRAAFETLDDVRRAQLGGMAVYGAASLVLAQAADRSRGGEPSAPGDWDLRHHMARGLYTLQVAVFDENAGRNFRQQAEAFAAEIREKGFPAYYYHASRSTVTVGLWSYEEAWNRVIGVQDTYSSMVTKVQETYPHNLLNGSPIPLRAADAPDAFQPSFLIHLAR